MSGETENSTTTEPKSSDSTGTEETKSEATSKPSASDSLKKDLAEERKRRQELEKAMKDKELAGMEEGERLKAEHADAKTAVGILQKENEDLKKENLKLMLALDLKLPLRVAKRLQGDTEDEMRADAQEFLKDLKLDAEGETAGKQQKRPPNDAKKGAGSGTGGPSMNELLRIAAGKGN